VVDAIDRTVIAIHAACQCQTTAALSVAAVETDHMSLHLPVQAQAFCDICKTEGTISLGSWELDDTSLAVVADLDELRRDGFTLRGGLIVCKGCLDDSNQHPGG
jgi:hypothetical protein